MASLSDVARKKCAILVENAQKRELRVCVREESAIVKIDGKKLISFSCNDYLGLSHHPSVKEAAIKALEQYGTGAGASRLVTGNHPLYTELEYKLAKWKGFEAALVTGSGYLANIGIIPALVDKYDLIIADKLVHACLIDGARLSGAKLLRFQHNDMADCARLLAAYRKDFRYCLMITDEVFSMDGDKAPLAELSRIAQQHEAWLMADGAHSLGNPEGEVDIYIGTLSKALGSYGGFICAKKEIINYLASTMRSFIFSTALPPSVIASAIAALEIVENNPELAYRPIANARIFTEALGLQPAQSPIVPVILSEEKKALAASAALAEAGYHVTAIRPPTVPKGTSRLRFAFSAQHEEGDVMKLAKIIKELY